MAETICKWCGAAAMDHDYQQLARECYPAQLTAADAQRESDAKVIAALREALDLIWHIAPLPTQSETERLERILKIAREARHIGEEKK